MALPSYSGRRRIHYTLVKNSDMVASLSLARVYVSRYISIAYGEVARRALTARLSDGTRTAICSIDAAIAPDWRIRTCQRVRRAPTGGECLRCGGSAGARQLEGKLGRRRSGRLPFRPNAERSKLIESQPAIGHPTPPHYCTRAVSELDVPTPFVNVTVTDSIA